MPSKFYTVKRCRSYEIIKSWTWYILFLRRLGHSGLLSAVKLLRVSSDETVSCDVKRTKIQTSKTLRETIS